MNKYSIKSKIIKIKLTKLKQNKKRSQNGLEEKKKEEMILNREKIF